MSIENTDTESLKTISIEELKKCEGLQGLSDQEALQIIETLKQIALVVYQTL